MAEPFATYVDVEARWRTLSSAEQTVATTLAVDASNMIRERWSDIDDRIAAGTVSEDSVVRVVAFMVKRAMDRPAPDGFETFTQGAGPFNAGGKLANPNGNLYFTALDLLVFEPEGSSRKSFVGWLA
jgi:hypothetical protein